MLSRLQLLKYIGITAAMVLVIACFLPWLYISSAKIMVTGMEATGTNFGKPGYINLILTVLFVVCTFIDRIGAKRLNLLITALNLGWAVRNFFLLSACSGGECPVKKIGLWLMLIASIIMLVAALFPDMKIPVKKEIGT